MSPLSPLDRLVDPAEPRQSGSSPSQHPSDPDGDRSPAQSGENSPHSKHCDCSVSRVEAVRVRKKFFRSNSACGPTRHRGGAVRASASGHASLVILVQRAQERRERSDVFFLQQDAGKFGRGVAYLAFAGQAGHADVKLDHFFECVFPPVVQIRPGKGETAQTRSFEEGDGARQKDVIGLRTRVPVEQATERR